MEALGTTIAYILLLSLVAVVGNIIWEVTGSLFLMIIVQYAIWAGFNEFAKDR